MGQSALDYAGMDEAVLAGRARAGDRDAFRAIMQRCNQRLFRVARALMRNNDEAEDVLQDAYLRAFMAFGDFRGESSLLKWLTTITLNEARARLRRCRHTVELAIMDESPSQIIFPHDTVNPEKEAGRQEARRLLEGAVDRLPPDFKVVFVLREIEGCTVEEAAEHLGINPRTVKTRLHRARRLLRRDLHGQFAAGVGEVFSFLGDRCMRIADRVLAKMP